MGQKRSIERGDALSRLGPWRKKYLAERTRWPQYNRKELTEYGFILRCQMKPVLGKLARAEARIADRSQQTPAEAVAYLHPMFDQMFRQMGLAA